MHQYNKTEIEKKLSSLQGEIEKYLSSNPEVTSEMKINFSKQFCEIRGELLIPLEKFSEEIANRRKYDPSFCEAQVNWDAFDMDDTIKEKMRNVNELLKKVETLWIRSIAQGGR